ncbi:MAG TPA: hypothetical protein VKR59_07845 [Terriglobales bacterium]|nr:hypothetical protein [Terriglobales bacterium]
MSRRSKYEADRKARHMDYLRSKASKPEPTDAQKAAHHVRKLANDAVVRLEIRSPKGLLNLMLVSQKSVALLHNSTTKEFCLVGFTDVQNGTSDFEQRIAGGAEVIALMEVSAFEKVRMNLEAMPMPWSPLTHEELVAAVRETPTPPETEERQAQAMSLVTARTDEEAEQIVITLSDGALELLIQATNTAVPERHAADRAKMSRIVQKEFARRHNLKAATAAAGNA